MAKPKAPHTRTSVRGKQFFAGRGFFKRKPTVSSSQELSELEQEAEKKEAEIALEEKLKTEKQRVAEDRKRLASLEEELHPTRFQKLRHAAISIEQKLADGYVQTHKSRKLRQELDKEERHAKKRKEV